MRILPGDPAKLVRHETGASADDIEFVRDPLRLDVPNFIRIWNDPPGTVRGNIGQSFEAERWLTTVLVPSAHPRTGTGRM
jgi:ABC-type dipeptide/oligopeptide/nickel transport system permease component